MADETMKPPICPLCTGDHPGWMCVDHLRRDALLDEVYKLRKTLISLAKTPPKNISKKRLHKRLGTSIL